MGDLTPFPDTPHPTALAAAIIRSSHVAPWENSAFLAYVRDASGQIVAVNLAFARKFGRAAASWMGRDVALLILPEDLDRWHKAVDTLDRAPHRVEYETRWLTPQGCRLIAWEETALFDEAGRIHLFRAIGRDVTRQRQAEDLSFRLTAAVEQSPIAIVITDTRGAVQYVNPKYTAFTGFSLEALLERQVDVLREGLETEEDRRAVIETVVSGKEWRGEVRTRNKEGNLLWESVKVSPIRNHSGDISHFLCLREDITERKRLEEQLRQSQKMESLGTLAGGIAHDFNNLLAIINGYTEICLVRMQGGSGDEALRRYLREVNGASQRAVGLVQRILTFSRKTEVRSAPFALNKVVRELAGLLAETFPRTIGIDLDLDEKLPMLNADPGQLQQVIMNLCVNARDAMPKGGQLVIRTFLESGAHLRHLGAEASQAYVCLRVSDTGLGMSPQVRARIFEPFFTTKQETGGTGLGLAVVYGITTSHKGLLDVESTPGLGSLFSVYLPSSPLVTKAGEPLVPSSSSDFPRGRESLLIAEDEASLRSLLVNVLEPCGYRVTCARDGREALKVIGDKAARIDALLLDLNMPEVPGLEVFREARALRPEMKTIIVSGNITVETKAELMKLGQKDYVGKPYRIEDLCRLLRKVLDSPATPAV